MVGTPSLSLETIARATAVGRDIGLTKELCQQAGVWSLVFGGRDWLLSSVRVSGQPHS